MYITVNGPDIKDFDFQAAAAVFIGAKKRLHVSVASLETPSARQAATAVLFDWSRTAAATAFDKQLLIAQGAASGEDVAPRMVSKQVEEKKRTTKAIKTKAASSSSSSSTTATAFFSPSASVSSATDSYPTSTTGRRIKRKHDNGSGSVFLYLFFCFLFLFCLGSLRP